MSLSPREKEVLALLAQGLSNAEIGRALFISPVTVKVHVRHVYEKLGVRSRAAAALRATQLGQRLGDADDDPIGYHFDTRIEVELSPATEPIGLIRRRKDCLECCYD